MSSSVSNQFGFKDKFAKGSRSIFPSITTTSGCFCGASFNPKSFAVGGRLSFLGNTFNIPEGSKQQTQHLPHEKHLSFEGFQVNHRNYIPLFSYYLPSLFHPE